VNRRRFLAGAGAAAVGTVAYGGLRVADVRPYDPTLPTGETPRERIVAAARHRHAEDHRAVTRVRVLDDWTGDAPYDLDVRRQWHEHSRRRHLHALTTFDTPFTRSDRISELADREFFTPHQTLWALLHYSRVFGDRYDLPLTAVAYLTDGGALYDYDAPTPESDTVRVSDGERRADGVTDEAVVKAVRGEFIRPHRTDWERVDDGGGTVTYRVSGPDAYAQVVPLPFAQFSTFGDCWVEATLDTETGRLRRVVDNRDVVVDGRRDGGGVPVTYRIETTFDRYGRATAPRPAGSADRSIESRLKGFLYDLATY
jgi:hypothetical protein